MSPVLLYGCLLWGVAGHLALWIAMYNRVHANHLPRPLIKLTEVMHVLLAVLIPAVWLLRLWAADTLADPLAAIFAGRFFEQVYFLICCSFLLYAAAIWCWRRAIERVPEAFVEGPTCHYDVSQQLSESLYEGPLARVLALIPHNQSAALTVTEKTFNLRQLDPRLDGVTIAHLSDFHFSGRIKRSYFDFVVDRANELDVDFVMVTGDIVDCERCLSWIPATLGRLRARRGIYFVLGNHDQRIRDLAGLRRALTDLGMMDAAGKVLEVRIENAPLLVAGTEWPWFSSRPALDRCPVWQTAEPALRLLLSHAPDQLPWARRHGFDLMLAGHTHGGQIRFPILGPLVSPSNYGVKYASGVFYEEPTLMHVSRGVSGLDPIRLNCPPEVTRLVLRASLVPAKAHGAFTRDQLVLATQTG